MLETKAKETLCPFTKRNCDGDKCQMWVADGTQPKRHHDDCKFERGYGTYTKISGWWFLTGPFSIILLMTYLYNFSDLPQVGFVFLVPVSVVFGSILYAFVGMPILNKIFADKWVEKVKSHKCTMDCETVYPYGKCGVIN